MKLFISYAHQNRDALHDILPYLKSFQREAVDFSYWHDDSLLAGDNLNTEIMTQIASSDVALLLVSASFIASRYCFEIELPVIRRRFLEGEMRVIPVICEACNWKEFWLKDLVAFPADGVPLSEIQRADSVLSKLHDVFRKEAAAQLGAASNKNLAEIGSSLELEHTQGSGFHIISYGEYLMVRIKNAILDRLMVNNRKNITIDWNLNEFGKERIEVSVYEKARLRNRYDISLQVDRTASIVISDMSGKEIVYRLYYDKDRFVLRVETEEKENKLFFETDDFIDRLVAHMKADPEKY